MSGLEKGYSIQQFQSAAGLTSAPNRRAADSRVQDYLTKSSKLLLRPDFTTQSSFPMTERSFKIKNSKAVIGSRSMLSMKLEPSNYGFTHQVKTEAHALKLMDIQSALAGHESLYRASVSDLLEERSAIDVNRRVLLPELQDKFSMNNHWHDRSMRKRTLPSEESEESAAVSDANPHFFQTSQPYHKSFKMVKGMHYKTYRLGLDSNNLVEASKIEQRDLTAMKLKMNYKSAMKYAANHSIDRARLAAYLGHKDGQTQRFSNHHGFLEHIITDENSPTDLKGQTDRSKEDLKNSVPEVGEDLNDTFQVMELPITKKESNYKPPKLKGSLNYSLMNISMQGSRPVKLILGDNKDKLPQVLGDLESDIVQQHVKEEKPLKQIPLTQPAVSMPVDGMYFHMVSTFKNPSNEGEDSKVLFHYISPYFQSDSQTSYNRVQHYGFMIETAGMLYPRLLEDSHKFYSTILEHNLNWKETFSGVGQLKKTLRKTIVELSNFLVEHKANVLYSGIQLTIYCFFNNKLVTAHIGALNVHFLDIPEFYLSSALLSRFGQIEVKKDEAIKQAMLATKPFEEVDQEIFQEEGDKAARFHKLFLEVTQEEKQKKDLKIESDIKSKEKTGGIK